MLDAGYISGLRQCRRREKVIEDLESASLQERFEHLLALIIDTVSQQGLGTKCPSVHLKSPNSRDAETQARLEPAFTTGCRSAEY